ncbi:MAG: serine protease, partial [Dehalococcoidia bacterium]
APSSATPIIVTPSPEDADGGGGGGPVTPDHELALSTVQVLAVSIEGGVEQVVRYGSGVVVDAEQALIATAYPVVVPNTPGGTRAYTSLVIATDRRPGTEPSREYLAEIVQADPDADLAVLRVVSDLAGVPLAEGDFDLPAVRLGDPSTVGAGFPIRAFGYPGIAPQTTAGSQVVTTQQATIGGQRGNVARTGRTWFKTDARMPFGAAGGPAFDRSGALIGILAQDRYLTSGVTAQVRPLDLLAPLVEAARSGDAFRPALHRAGMMPGTLLVAPASGVFVGQPAFAENAVETNNGRDLFDYETRFVAGLGSLYYEYEVNGATDGAVIEERWFLDSVRQESLNSSVVWDGGAFGLVNDRITAPGASGIPTGRWRLEVYVDGVQHTMATAIVGVPVGEPALTFAYSASAATPQGDLAAEPFTGASQLLMGFDVSGMLAVRSLEWVVFRDNQPIYTSPPVRWEHGDSGRFWIGYSDPNATIGPGTWEFEIHGENGGILAVGTVTLF